MRSTLTLILTILATFCQNSGECPIECYCDQVTTCTGDKLLIRFPKIYTTLDSEPVTRLELHEYSVSYLSKEDFLQIISNLTELSLSRNSKLERFDNETFSLSFSPLQGRPSTSTTGVELLAGEGDEHHFSSARSSSTKSEEEQVLLKLRILDLSQNKLNYFVGGGRLKRLKILDLSSNKLQQVYGLGFIENLESVNLRDNRISYLQPATFQGLKHLQYINLDSNNLEFVDPSTFSNLPALAHLILSSNPVTNLVPGFFWNSRVQFVDVSHVGLSHVPTSLTKTVRDFRCANNNLTIIRQTDFESFPNVGLLVLDENAIETVEEDAFGRLDFLTRLWMNGNRLRRVPQNLPPSLQSLHLEANLIVNLSSSDFKNLRNLQELNLHGNRISSLPSFVFAELTSLKNLDLRSNEIDVIYRDSFSNLSKLTTLDISQNPIKVIVTGAFELVKLSLLHLSRLMEPIEFDTTSFSPLQKLQILELDDSPHFAQKLIQDLAFTHLQNLRELNIQRCELEDLNAVSNALAELNLQVVKLGGNPWDCHDLYGSTIFQLMSRRTVVDQPECEQPKNLKGVLVSSLNFSAVSQTTQSTPELEEGSEENLLDFTELTPDLEQHEHEEDLEQISYSSSSGSSGSSGSSESLHSQSHTTMTSTSLDKVTNAPNTNSSENSPHAADGNVNPFRSLSLPAATSAGPTNNRNGHSPSTALSAAGESGQRTKNLPTSFPHPNPPTPTAAPSLSTFQGTNNTVVVNTTVVPTSKSKSASSTLDAKVSATNRPNDSARSESADRIRTDNKNISVARNSDSVSSSPPRSSLDDLDAVPTNSYFDSSWRGSHPVETVETRTNSISSPNTGSSSGGSVGGRRSGSKKPAISIPIAGARTASLDKTKTNDDNTIIDERGKHRSSSGSGASSSGGNTERYRGLNDGEETGPKSIDGFPSGYSDVDGLSSSNSNELPTSIRDRDGKPVSVPTAFHLRRGSKTGTTNQLESQPTSSAIIVKTILISATVCLVSILLLLSLSLAVYKVSRRRSGTFLCSSVTRRKSEEDADSSAQAANRTSTSSGRIGYTRTSYTRFGRKSDRSCNQNLHQGFDSDSDYQVELSGITNRLYSENEEIYHIT